MEIIPENIRKLWSIWELRNLVLISLFIQTLLISFASFRKHTAARKISFLVWVCYLMADWVAILALGALAESVMNNSNGGSKDKSSENKRDDLKSLWAPFLLLHLGGPDNITAFSLEDNELWLRHLLGLLFQVGTAFYIFILALPEEYKLCLITILMFMGGIIKYAERTLALMKASRENFRKSMVTDPDPGPNYAKFMEEYSCKKNAGLDPRIVCVREPAKLQLPPTLDIEEVNEDSSQNMSDVELICKAHHFFQIFQRLIVDLILTFHDRNGSRSFFTKPILNEAYKVIEIELGFLYEVLYTKAAVVYTLRGWFLRFISVSSITFASIIFFVFIEKQRYDRIDVKITYVLLTGAIALESWSLTRLLFSDWTIVWMKKKNLNPRLTRFVFKVLSYKRPPNRSRWSNSMAQYNLIKFCVKDQLFFWGKVMELFHVKDLFDCQWHRTYKEISEDLKKFIFENLRCKLQKAIDSSTYQHFRTCRGQLALQMINTDEVLDNSIKTEFDESILLWHIATDICYYLDGETENLDETVMSYQTISRDISNYMLYLLVSRPYMLTAGIGQIRFGDTCAEAKRFFHRRDQIEIDEKQGCIRLHNIDTEVPPVQVKGDRSKSVLFEASRVAKSLLKMEPDVKKRWEVIRLVWLEMLCYAASECRGYYHAQRLIAGGELLTVVCFLMAHLGIGEQYRVESGHARAKLIVKM